MGPISKFQSIEIQNPRRSPLNNMDLVWTKDIENGRAHIIEVECTYMPHARVLKFINNEQNRENSSMERMSKCQEPKTTLAIFGMMFYCSILLYSFFFNLISYPTLSPKLIAHFVASMHGGIDQRTILETQTTIKSIKRGYLTQFLIKQMYTQLEVAKIIFYHQLHTQADGKPMHGKHDLDSIMWPYVFAPQISQALKDNIWIQLGLSYTINKYMTNIKQYIWWARINARKWMTSDKFMREQDIAYLDPKHKRKSYHLHKNLTISLCTWAFNYLFMMCFIFKM
jgi:hypothetical protein